MDDSFMLKDWRIRMQFKSFMEALKGNQHKLDKNKNGKLDAHDFELLRKEESELSEEERMARADYKVGPSGRKAHKEIVFKDGSENQEQDDKLKREEVEIQESSDDAHFSKQTPKMQDAINRHLRMGKSYKDAVAAASKHVKEETELAEESQKHIVNVTVSDPNHTMVSKRKETIQKRATVTAKSRESAVDTALAHYKKQGYKVHDHNYVGLKEEVEQIDEVNVKQIKKDLDSGLSYDAVIGKHANKKLTNTNEIRKVIQQHAWDKRMKKEEVEQIDEKFINGREYASQGVMHPDHAKYHKVGNSMDFYAHGTGDKISGKVTKNDGKSVHIQADKSSGGKLHKFTVTPHLPKPVNEAKKDDIPFDGPYKKVQGDGNVKDKSGAVHTPMSQARHLARQAMKKQMKEDVEFDILDEAVESGNKGYGYHGAHPSETADKEYAKAHATVKKVAGSAGHLKDAKKPNVMVKHYLDSRHGRHLADVGTNDHEYIKKDFGKFKKSYKESDFSKESVGFDNEGNLVSEKKTFTQFVEELKQIQEGQTIQVRPGVTRHIGTYGTAKGAKYGHTDYDKETMDKKDDDDEKTSTPAVKRGRGRPAGSKSGANQKVTSGKSYGGIATHSLNLPNTNR